MTLILNSFLILLWTELQPIRGAAGNRCSGAICCSWWQLKQLKHLYIPPSNIFKLSHPCSHPILMSPALVPHSHLQLPLPQNFVLPSISPLPSLHFPSGSLTAPPLISPALIHSSFNSQHPRLISPF